jgi:two-component system, LytTR family, response regulator
MPIRVLIVDDEQLARKRIADLLQQDSDVQIVGQVGNGTEALQLVQQEAPDLLFLDVQMPEGDGFELLEAVGTETMPAVILVTAYDKYALRAFDIQAVDYLLKPFSEGRFRQALERAKEQISKTQQASVADPRLPVHAGANGKKYPSRLVIKSGGKVLFIKTSEIDYVEAAGNYLSIVVGKDSHLIRDTMQNFETRLDPEHFIRIHRSTLVNIDRVRELQPLFGGEYAVLLRDGRQLTLSRTYRNRLQQLLEH